MAHRAPAVPRQRLVLLLAGAAGCLDAVGYLMLGLFTANMTGNTILLGLSVGQAAWTQALHNVVAIAAFVAGAGAGTAALRGLRQPSSGLGLEAGLLAAAMAAWARFGAPRGHVGDPAAYWLIALLSAAMGIQSATVRRVGEQRVSTTYVTGTLTSLATETARDLLDRWSPRPAGASGHPAPALGPAGEHARGTALLTGVWAVYLVGALVGGFAEYRWSMGAVAAPLAALVAVIVADVWHRAKEGTDR